MEKNVYFRKVKIKTFNLDRKSGRLAKVWQKTRRNGKEATFELNSALFSVFGEVFSIKEERDREKSSLSQQRERERERESEKKKGREYRFRAQITQNTFQTLKNSDQNR